MVQNEVPVVPECFLASRKTCSEEQKNTYVRDHSNYAETLCELANSHQAVHLNARAASHWGNGRGWPRK